METHLHSRSWGLSYCVRNLSRCMIPIRQIKLTNVILTCSGSNTRTLRLVCLPLIKHHDTADVQKGPRMQVAEGLGDSFVFFLWTGKCLEKEKRWEGRAEQASSCIVFCWCGCLVGRQLGQSVVKGGLGSWMDEDIKRIEVTYGARHHCLRQISSSDRVSSTNIIHTSTMWSCTIRSFCFIFNCRNLRFVERIDEHIWDTNT